MRINWSLFCLIGRVFTLPIVVAVLVAPPARAAAPEPVRCQQLRDMARAWAGVPLTAEQKVAKRALVRWYAAHCRRRDVEL